MKKFYKENKALSLSLIICAGLVLLYPWVLIFIWPIPFVIVLLKKLSPRIDKWGTKVDKIIQSTSKKIDSFGDDKVSKRIKATSNKLEKKQNLVKNFAMIAVGLVIVVVCFNLLFLLFPSKVLQDSHIIKCRDVSGKFRGSDFEYIMDKNTMTVTINATWSDFAKKNNWEDYGISSEELNEKKTKTWRIETWNRSEIFWEAGSNIGTSWDGKDFIAHFPGHDPSPMIGMVCKILN